jgi:small-conductance mechanosensitive channel/FtsZ-binding cell division protein ZapB
MKRILTHISAILLLTLAGFHALYAQTDSVKKQAPATVQTIDSAKNQILSHQTDEIQSIKADQEVDSIRLLQLQYELLKLGNNDNTKKHSIVTERDQIKIKDSLRKVQQHLKIDSLRSLVSGFPVVLSDDTIFYVFAKIGSYLPEERAHAISGRISKLADDYYFKEDSLMVVSSDLTTDVNYKDEVITSIAEPDAVWMNSTKQALAENYRTKILNAIREYKVLNSWPALFRDFAIAVLVLSILIGIIFSINKMFKWIKNQVEKQRGHKLRGFKIRNYEFLDTNRQLYWILSLISVIKWILILTFIYLTLPVLFGLFPWTGGFAGKLISYFLNPVKHILVSLWDYMPNFFTIIVLIIFFRYLLRILFYFKGEIERGSLKIPGFYVDWANPTFQIIRVLILAFALIIIFPYLPGSDSQIFKGVSVFLGVLFTFGSAGALSNVVAGLVLTYMRAYKIGDRVRIGEATGDVVEKSLLVTRIKTIKNEIVSIPNSTVMSSHTTNFSAEAIENGLIIHTTVTIGYENPWRQIHDLLIKAALATELVEKDPAPFVFQTSLDDFYVSYQINAYTRDAREQQTTYSILHQNIQDKFNEAGVEIMSAHYKYIRDGNQSTVPPDHLPDDYIAPVFRVQTKD